MSNNIKRGKLKKHNHTINKSLSNNKENSFKENKYRCKSFQTYTIWHKHEKWETKHKKEMKKEKWEKNNKNYKNKISIIIIKIIITRKKRTIDWIKI